MEFLTIVIIGVILLVVGVFGVGILIKLGKVALSILLHMVLGWVILFIWNILPFFKIPINILTMLVAGFGGIIGVGVLILAKGLGLYWFLIKLIIFNVFYNSFHILLELDLTEFNNFLIIRTIWFGRVFRVNINFKLF